MRTNLGDWSRQMGEKHGDRDRAAALGAQAPGEIGEVATDGGGVGLELGDPASALGQGEAAGFDATTEAGQSADVADGVGRDGAMTGGLAEHARQGAAAGLGGCRAAAVADAGDELVDARNSGFAEV